MHVAAILKEKGTSVETVHTDACLADVARRLAEKRIGAVVVLHREGSIAGIVSERDIVAALARAGARCLEQPVADFMTRDVKVCSEDDTIDQLMGIMTQGRFRHLPVVSDGRLAGIISIGDVVKHHIAEVELEAMAMRDYITASG